MFNAYLLRRLLFHDYFAFEEEAAVNAVTQSASGIGLDEVIERSRIEHLHRHFEAGQIFDEEGDGLRLSAVGADRCSRCGKCGIDADGLGVAFALAICAL